MKKKLTRKQKARNFRTGIFLLILFFIILLILYFGFPSEVDELYNGLSAKNFCSEKCDGYDLLTSNNNSNYQFIRCECLVEARTDANIFGPIDVVKTNVLYFDSKSLNEIEEKEVLNRIYDKN